MAEKNGTATLSVASLTKLLDEVKAIAMKGDTKAMTKVGSIVSDLTALERIEKRFNSGWYKPDGK